MYPLLKRFFDCVLSFVGLIVFSSIMLIIGISIKLDSKGPIIFKQKRIGKRKTEFYMYKFRTMYSDAPKDTPTHLLRDSKKYTTKVGRLLRRTSLDELPQLWNILLGHMSIIGPRPALWNQYDLVSERDKYNANDIRPGLTGWAQINGRDELDIPDKARLDGYYAEKLSFHIDWICFFKTIKAVIRGDGVVER